MTYNRKRNSCLRLTLSCEQWISANVGGGYKIVEPCSINFSKFLALFLLKFMLLKNELQESERKKMRKLSVWGINKS